MRKALTMIVALGLAVAGATTASAAVTPRPAPAPAPRVVPAWMFTSKYTFPVAASNVAWHDTHSAYPATDIFAACGSTVVATDNGRVLEISLVDRFRKGMPDGPYNGGLFVSILGNDGVRYYGSHLSSVTKGIVPGALVKSGQQIGRVGHTGNANGVCHLHYAISPPCAQTGDWKVRRGVVWPYSFLASWRGNGQKSPVDTVAAWNKSHHCKA
ncbi:peptidase M23 [Actinoplanes sp. SE50]|uniref:M23 family metallopeptidase n=1 Tax=unclassified Actinoplanes TaxID=2626549 RepID=UPI00023EE098|nr:MULTISPECIES: M23 family metallopeptidase [unclassified Actinoplanes]AEV89019.1 L-Ala-D-Glu endopeptidase [Actinoplanes sp. SE50/110]ATO87425.1 peptidase M23 [Actinoplanes sp. SE50]SLM04843.1 peptidase M23 [Actinoplanes sp. SE50/110]